MHVFCLYGQVTGNDSQASPSNLFSLLAQPPIPPPSWLFNHQSVHENFPVHSQKRSTVFKQEKLSKQDRERAGGARPDLLLGTWISFSNSVLFTEQLQVVNNFFFSSSPAQSRCHTFEIGVISNGRRGQQKIRTAFKTPSIPSNWRANRSAHIGQHCQIPQRTGGEHLSRPPGIQVKSSPQDDDAKSLLGLPSTNKATSKAALRALLQLKPLPNCFICIDLHA